MAPPNPPPKAIDLNRIIADAKSRVRANGGKEDPKYAELVDKSIAECLFPFSKCHNVVCGVLSALRCSGEWGAVE